jgi:hypothetical protein
VELVIVDPAQLLIAAGPALLTQHRVAHRPEAKYVHPICQSVCHRKVKRVPLRIKEEQANVCSQRIGFTTVIFFASNQVQEKEQRK